MQARWAAWFFFQGLCWKMDRREIVAAPAPQVACKPGLAAHALFIMSCIVHTGSLTMNRGNAAGKPRGASVRFGRCICVRACVRSRCIYLVDMNGEARGKQGGGVPGISTSYAVFQRVRGARPNVEWQAGRAGSVSPLLRLLGLAWGHTSSSILQVQHVGFPVPCHLQR